MTPAGTAGHELAAGDAQGAGRPAGFTVIGDDDAGLCVDGFCALPPPAREAAQSVT